LDYSEDVILKVFHLENGIPARVELPDLLGDLDTIFEVQREDDVIRVRRQGSSKPWKVLFVNVHSIQSDRSSKETPDGALISLNSSTDFLEAKILS